MKKQAESISRKSEKEKYLNEDFQKDYHKKINRKLAFSAVGTPDYVAPEVQGRGIIYFNFKLDILKLLTGGQWVLYCMKCLLVIHHLLLNNQDKLGIRFRTGESIWLFQKMLMLVHKLLI